VGLIFLNSQILPVQINLFGLDPNIKMINCLESHLVIPFQSKKPNIKYGCKYMFQMWQPARDNQSFSRKMQIENKIKADYLNQSFLLAD